MLATKGGPCASHSQAGRNRAKNTEGQLLRLNGQRPSTSAKSLTTRHVARNKCESSKQSRRPLTRSTMPQCENLMRIGDAMPHCAPSEKRSKTLDKVRDRQAREV